MPLLNGTFLFRSKHDIQGAKNLLSFRIVKPVNGVTLGKLTYPAGTLYLRYEASAYSCTSNRMQSQTKIFYAINILDEI